MSNPPALKTLSGLPGYRSTGKQQWEARCPGHEDRKASLAISIGNDDRILLHCFAGCDLAHILEAAGLDTKDLFANNGNGHKTAGIPHIVESYDYKLADGELSYQVVRFEPKDFRQRRPDGAGGWIWDTKGLKRIPYNLPEFAAAEYIFVVEGEKDVESLRKIGLIGTCNSGGAGKWTAELSQHFTNLQHVTIIPDNDEPGRKHAEQVAASLHGVVTSVKILELAALPKHGDLTEWLKDRDPQEAAKDLCRLAEAAPEWRPAGDTNPEPPPIDASDADLDRATRAAWAALIGANRPAYMFRHGTLARIERGESGAPILRELTLERLRYELARQVRYQIKKDDRVMPAHPPIAVCKNILATPDPELPPLTRIVEVPVFGPDSTLQTEPGYNPICRTYYAPDPSFVLPIVPTIPKRDDFMRARVMIDLELLCDFPFASDAEKTNAVGLYLLPYVRDLISGPTPLHLIEKPCQGTGATLLADAISYPATGHSIAATTEGRDEDEWRKRLTAKLATGPSFVLFDNLRRRLDSANVSAAITATSWEDRRLGHSEMILTPVRCAWIATGNNPALSGEIARRTVRIRLDSKTDQPWLRTNFRHPDLRSWMKEHRADLVWSALTLVRWWIAQGHPKAPASIQRLGGFECWTEVIGGILAATEYDGFLSNLQEFYSASDIEGAIWRGFVEAWWTRFQTIDVGVSDLYPLADELDLGDGKERSQKTRLGTLLCGMRDRQFGKYRINAAPKKHGASMYQLVNLVNLGNLFHTT